MSNQYQINVYNKYSSSVKFSLFQEPPQLGEGETVFTNVYQSSGDTEPDQGSAGFTITDTFYGVCGTTNLALNPDATVQNFSSLPVQLATETTGGTVLYCTTAPDGSPYFDTTKTKPTGSNAPGSYQIVTDATVTPNDLTHPFIGLGCSDRSAPGHGTPTAVMQGEGSLTYTIYPQIKFYICQGSYSQGNIIDVSTVGQTQLVDFSAGDTPQTFTYTESGLFVSGSTPESGPVKHQPHHHHHHKKDSAPKTGC